MFGMRATHYLAASVLTLPLLFGAAGAPRAAEVTKIRVATEPIIDTAPFEAAIEKGYFRDEGIEIEAVPVLGGAAALPALAAGKLDISTSNIITAILGAAQGFDFKIVAAGDATRAEPPDLAGLVAKPSSTMTSCKDLEGKRLAVSARRGGIWLYARGCIAATGGDPEKVTYIEVPFPQMIDAVKQGRVDAAFVVEPFFTAGIKSEDVKFVAWPYNTVLKNAPIMEWVSSNQFIAANPDAVARFVRAYQRGAAWINTNAGTDEWITMVSKYTKIAPEFIRHVAAPVYPTSVDKDKVLKIVELMQHEGLVKAEAVDLGKLIHETALPKSP
jgi:NitT/TauT family transport system substrate-binding protein